jgi:hypothetical protein
VALLGLWLSNIASTSSTFGSAACGASARASVSHSRPTSCARRSKAYPVSRPSAAGVPTAASRSMPRSRSRTSSEASQRAIRVTLKRLITETRAGASTSASSPGSGSGCASDRLGSARHASHAIKQSAAERRRSPLHRKGRDIRVNVAQKSRRRPRSLASCDEPA